MNLRVEEGVGAVRAGNEPGTGRGGGCIRRPCWRVSSASDLAQHARQDLQAQVLLVAQPVGTALDHSDLVVESFHETQRYFVLRTTVGGDAVPMPLDHRGELLVRVQPLPLQGGLPVLEEASCPT